MDRNHNRSHYRGRRRRWERGDEEEDIEVPSPRRYGPPSYYSDNSDEDQENSWGYWKKRRDQQEENNRTKERSTISANSSAPNHPSRNVSPTPTNSTERINQRNSSSANSQDVPMPTPSEGPASVRSTPSEPPSGRSKRPKRAAAKKASRRISGKTATSTEEGNGENTGTHQDHPTVGTQPNASQHSESNPIIADSPSSQPPISTSDTLPSVKDLSNDSAPQGPQTSSNQSIFQNFKCVVCLDTVVDPTATFCGHVFCEPCIMASIESNNRCPTCRCKLSLNEIHPLFV